MKLREQNLYFDFLVKSGLLSEDLKDSIRYDILSNIYWYGDHNRVNLENNNFIIKLKSDFFSTIKDFVILKKVVQNLYIKNKKIDITSSAYFNLQEVFKNTNYVFSTPPWKVSLNENFYGDYTIYKKCKYISNSFVSKNLNELISKDFIERLNSTKKILRNYFIETEHKALFVPNDVSFFENISLKIFKEIGLKSFVSLHGIPARYNALDENRGDYLLVWGEKIKDNYIKAGIDKNKIIVTGHPKYSLTQIKKIQRNGLENILILSSSLSGKPSSSYEVKVGDRTNNLFYLYSIQKTLEKFNVKKVRLRCHPGENPQWYIRHLDMSFFEIDKIPLKSSLERATLVIGNTSTVLFESLYYGVNYIVYEPIQSDGSSLSGYPLYPPFDGSDSRVAWCNNTDDLAILISKKSLTEVEILVDYFNIGKPFNVAVVQSLIE